MHFIIFRWGKVFWEILIFKTLKKMKTFSVLNLQKLKVKKNDIIKILLQKETKKIIKKKKKPTKEWQTILVFAK